MKQFTFGISLALLAGAIITSSASAQRYDTRIDVPRVIDPNRDYDRDYRGGDWDQRVRGEIDALNSDVARMRSWIGDSRDREIRARFREIRRATDRLNYAYNRGSIRGWEARRRIDAIRADLDSLRRAMRGRQWR